MLPSRCILYYANCEKPHQLHYWVPAETIHFPLIFLLCLPPRNVKEYPFNVYGSEWHCWCVHMSKYVCLHEYRKINLYLKFSVHMYVCTFPSTCVSIFTYALHACTWHQLPVFTGQFDCLRISWQACRWMPSKTCLTSGKCQCTHVGQGADARCTRVCVCA